MFCRIAPRYAVLGAVRTFPGTWVEESRKDLCLRSFTRGRARKANFLPQWKAINIRHFCHLNPYSRVGATLARPLFIYRG